MISGNIDGIVGNPLELFPDQRDLWMLLDRLGDRLREALPIDGERGTGRDAARLRRAHDERTKPAHLLFQETDGVIELVAAERIGAHQLGEPIGLVNLGRPHRAHLVQDDAHAGRSRLPGGF